MPYVSRRVSENRVCVYKKKPDGTAGERVGCTTPGKLKDYMAALHIHDKDKGGKSEGGKS